MKFVYKVRFACGIICFVDIGTDGSSTSDNLVDKYTSAFACIYLVTDGDYM